MKLARRHLGLVLGVALAGVAARAAELAPDQQRVLTLWRSHGQAIYDTYLAWNAGDGDKRFTAEEVFVVREHYARAEDTAGQLKVEADRARPMARVTIRNYLRDTAEPRRFYREWLLRQPEPEPRPEPQAFTIRLSGGRAIVSERIVMSGYPGDSGDGDTRLLFTATLPNAPLTLEIVKPTFPWGSPVVQLVDEAGDTHVIEPEFFRAHAQLALSEAGLAPEATGVDEDPLLTGVQGMLETLRDPEPTLRAAAVAALPLATTRFLARHLPSPAGLPEQIEEESARRQQLFAVKGGSPGAPRAAFENALLRVRALEALQQSGANDAALLADLLAPGGVAVVAEMPEGLRTLPVSRHTRLQVTADTLQIDALQVPLTSIQEFSLAIPPAKPAAQSRRGAQRR